MIVFVSDIHFRDENQWTVNEHATEGFITKSLIPQIQDARAKEVTVVFLGDIVDINRSPYWVDDQLSHGYTPWSHWTATLNEIRPGSVPLDQRFDAMVFQNHILTVLDRIRDANARNYELWNQFKTLDRAVWGSDGHRPERVVFEFVPGNHDRLSQYNIETRRRLIEHLNLDQLPEQEFPWVKYDAEHRVLALHGHVLGEMDFGGRSEQPDDYAASPWYKFPSLGDVATVTFGVRLYHDFMLSTPLRDMLAEIDLVRPQSEVLRWLRFRIASSPQLIGSLNELVARLARNFVGDPFVNWRLSGWEKTLLWFVGTPRNIDDTMNLFDKLSGGEKTKEEYTQEMVGKITTGNFMSWVNRQYPRTPNIVSGHTHYPLLTPVLGDHDGDPQAPMHYFNTGAWLDAIEMARGRGFARRHQVTHVTFYKDGEDAKPDGTRSYWEYWEGCLK